MRAVFEVVALNFNDLLQLESEVGRILTELVYIRESGQEIRVRFTCDSDEGVSAFVNSENYARRIDSLGKMKGVSQMHATRIIVEKLRNYVTAGGKYAVVRVTGRDGAELSGLDLVTS